MFKRCEQHKESDAAHRMHQDVVKHAWWHDWQNLIVVRIWIGVLLIVHEIYRSGKVLFSGVKSICQALSNE